MSAALFISLQQDVDFDVFVNGKALSKAEAALDQLATELDVQPLMSFFSFEPSLAQSMLKEMGVEAAQVPADREVEWYEASDGLATVRALMAHLQTHPQTMPDADAVVGDLQGFERVLKAAERQNIGWHLEIDF